MTDAAARITALTQLVDSAERRLAERREKQGFQTNDTAQVDNFTKLLVDSLDIPGRINELEVQVTKLQADLYDRDVQIAALKTEVNSRVPEADYTQLKNDFTRVQAENKRLKGKTEK